MVAAMSEVDLEQESVPEIDWRTLDNLLKYWGSARWRVGLCGGYPEQSAIVGRVELYEPREWFQVSQLTAQGRQSPYFGGHRILYDAAWNVSRRLLMVNMAVNALPEPQFRAIVVSYAIGYTAGEDFSHKQKADMLEISPDALSERLRRARKNLGRTLAKATGWR
jgi:DNA-directed RNA polymerase specialized sigma24 family protein